MKIFPSLLCSLLLLGACTSQPDSDSVVPIESIPQKSEQVEENVTENYIHYISEADLNMFRVIKVFKIDPIDVETYPELFEEFKKACEAWVAAVPVLEIYVDLTNTQVYAIPVIFIDLQQLGFPEGWLGYYDKTFKQIVVDVDVKDLETRMVYKTFLHELGHAFGVPHILGREYGEEMYKYVQDGAVLAPTDELAQQFLMYPAAYSGPTVPETSFYISEFEARLATDRLVASR